MVIVQNILIVIATFVLMEGAAWVLHKYIMHGFLWNLHHDHHNPSGHHFQKNDSFLLIFAVPSFLLSFIGLQNGPEDYRVWIAVGIAIYGLIYFIVHDVFIHQRFKALKRSNNPYLIAIRKAHKVHHKYREKEDGECFGMLWVPIRYYREAWEYTKKLKEAKR
ncbi:MAG: sterol desaturase family protein [Bacteroidia bacterium]|nr:sterol desaturase family protein [Bacteroidia bacterium]